MDELVSDVEKQVAVFLVEYKADHFDIWNQHN